MKKIILIVPLVILLFSMLMNALFTSEARMLDTADGKDAQQVFVNVPISGTPEYDQQYSQIYKNYAEGNKSNAEAETSTTVGNAQATQIYTNTWISVTILAIGIIAIAFLMDKFREI